MFHIFSVILRPESIPIKPIINYEAMKKKLGILAALLCLAISPVLADEIVLTPIFTPTQGPVNRSPVLVPEFYLDAHTLTAGSYTVGSTVELKNEDGEVVFTSNIYVEGDTITLPSTLSGTYTIEVTRGSLTFVGEIEL